MHPLIFRQYHSLGNMNYMLYLQHSHQTQSLNIHTVLNPFHRYLPFLWLTFSTPSLWTCRYQARSALVRRPTPITVSGRRHPREGLRTVHLFNIRQVDPRIRPSPPLLPTATLHADIHDGIAAILCLATTLDIARAIRLAWIGPAGVVHDVDRAVATVRRGLAIVALAGAGPAAVGGAPAGAALAGLTGLVETDGQGDHGNGRVKLESAGSGLTGAFAPAVASDSDLVASADGSAGAVGSSATASTARPATRWLW